MKLSLGDLAYTVVYTDLGRHYTLIVITQFSKKIVQTSKKFLIQQQVCFFCLCARLSVFLHHCRHLMLLASKFLRFSEINVEICTDSSLSL